MSTRCLPPKICSFSKYSIMFFKFSHLYFVLDLQIPSDNLENHSKNRYSKSQSWCPMMATVTYQNENSAVFSSVNWFLLGIHILLKINPLHDSLYRKTTFTHCVLLKHYYSVDYPWWFDRKICRGFFHFTIWWLKRKNLSNDRNSKLHFAIWQINCFRWILSACSSGLRFCTNLQINLEAKSMHGSSWKKNLLYQNLLYFLQGKSFSLWMASIGHNLDKFWFAFWEKV